ncbi:MAG: hypothetical protein AAB405_03095 [Patescibacteria group bacterium]
MKNQKSGQIMLLSIMIIGTSMMVITIIAGYLIVQRLRFSSNMADSAKAVFAADAGIECELYNIFKADPDIVCNDLMFKDSLTTVETLGGAFYIKSTGASNKSKRAFYLSY